MILEGLRMFYSIKRWLTSLCYSKEKQYKSEILHNDCVLLECITCQQYGESLTKYRIWNSNKRWVPLSDDEIIALFNKPVVSPWVWFGGVDKKTGDSVDHTEEMNMYLLSGNIITRGLLEYIDNNIVWAYLDSQTFERREFTVDQLVIADDSSRVERTPA